MDSDKAGSVSYKGYGGHVRSRLAGFSNWLFIKFYVDSDRAFCRFRNADDELGGCIWFTEQSLRLPRISPLYQARQQQCLQDVQGLVHFDEYAVLILR
jgi:hypothetical protein